MIKTTTLRTSPTWGRCSPFHRFWQINHHLLHHKYSPPLPPTNLLSFTSHIHIHNNFLSSSFHQLITPTYNTINNLLQHQSHHTSTQVFSISWFAGCWVWLWAQTSLTYIKLLYSHHLYSLEPHSSLATSSPLLRIHHGARKLSRSEPWHWRCQV